ncbi:FtsX-like permease family protein [Sulfuricurvum sp.]|uniref:ABC transporter permease n=1 Tax=Sulfuricurvum sp. TaxID=2025608 RepID=UPI003BB03616
MFSPDNSLYFKMALLHILRRKGRAVLISLMIAISMIGLLLMEGMYEGMMVQITQNSIKTGSGTVSIQHKGFRSDNNIKFHIDNPQKITAILDNQQGIRSYVTRLSQRGLIATAGYSQGVNVIGVDLKREASHSELENFLTQGKYTFDKQGRGALIGYRLARKLKVDIGKKVIVTVQDTDNEVVSVALKVTGILKTNNMSIDSNGLLMDIDRLRILTGIEGATEIAVLLNHQEDDNTVKHALSPKISDKDIAIYTYRELYPSLYEGEAMMKIYNRISSAFIFIVATLGIFGVVLVSVLERVREFGIMMAIGTQFRDVARLIIYESLLITLSGYLAGALIGGTLLWYFKVYGLDLSGLSDAFAIFGMDSSIHAILRIDYFTGSFVSVLLATLSATIIPIRTLKKRNPIQSISEQAQ